MVKIKKILSAVLMAVLICIASGMAVTASAAGTITPTQPAGEGTSSSPYQISNAGELYWFAGLVNGTLSGVTQNKSASAELTQNITVNSSVLTSDYGLNAGDFIPWTPIGISSQNYYRGNFDGKGYTISGLYFKDTTASNVGLFGYAYYASISNVGVIDSYFKAKEYVGGICGYKKSNNIVGCYSKATVEGTSNYVGGICGYSEESSINKCYNTGYVTLINIKTENDSQFYVGGICGYNGSGNTVENCYNSGRVSATGACVYAGGISGYNYNNISDSYNIGEISKYSEAKVGLLCGYNKNSYGLNNCYYLDVSGMKATAYNYVEGRDGGNRRKTQQDFASGAVAYLLNGSKSDGEPAWRQNLSKDGKQDYPVLSGEKVYQATGCTGCYSNTAGETKEHGTHDENGFCPYCGGNYQKPDKVTGKYDIDGDGKLDDAEVYEISNAGQLYWFAGLVNGDTSVCDYDAETNPTGTQQNSAANAVVTDYIYVNDTRYEPFVDTLEFWSDMLKYTTDRSPREWIPIGMDEEHPYTGVFIGNGNINSSGLRGIFGLYMNDRQNDKYGGMFGYLGEGGCIANVYVRDSYITAKYYVSAVCAYNNGGTIKNCVNDSKLFIYQNDYASSNETWSIGGVCGYNNGGTIKGCFNEFNSSANPSAIVEAKGGYDRFELINVGGVCGYNNGGTISRCDNKGRVKCENLCSSFCMNVGGICGYNKGFAKTENETENIYYGNINNCNNYFGLELATNDWNIRAGSEDHISVGGLIGRDEKYSKVSKCYNEGDITFTGGTGKDSQKIYIGGLVGKIEHGITEHGIFENCYNIGKISADVSKISEQSSLKLYIGGLFNKPRDYSYVCIAKNCHNVGEISLIGSPSCESYVGGIFGKYESDSRDEIANCYYNSDLFADAVGSGAGLGAECGKTAAQFASGEVTYLLNDSKSEVGVVWYQSLSGGTKSDYPDFYGRIVYQTTPCITYTNDDTSLEKSHSDFNTDGFCPDCGIYQPAGKNADGVYEISNAGQLYWFAGLVNGDTSVCDYDAETNPTGTQQNSAANAKLTDSFAVNSNLLESLVYNDKNEVTNGSRFKAWTPIGSETNRYTGTFDGNNKTISGLYFNDKAKDYVGLFGYIGYRGKVKNVGVVDIYINADDYVGGLCGYNYGEYSTNGNVIENSYTKGKVIGYYYVGGLCGYNRGENANSITINNCYSTVDVTAQSYAGGLCGRNYAYRANAVVISDCYSTGNATASNTVNTDAYAGKISGYNGGEVVISNCYSVGAVSATGRTVTYDYSEKDVINCYYLADSETAESKGFTGKTEAQFASGEVAWLLNGNSSDGAWKQTLTGDNADVYPVFGGSTVYQTTPCTLEYSNVEGTTKEHSHNSEYVCACGDKIIKIVTSTNETTVPELTADTVLYEKDSTTASDFKYDGTSTVTTVYVKIYNPTTGVKPIIKIAGDNGTVESQTWTAVEGTNIYYAQFIGDFADFGTIEVTYEGADSVTIPTTTSTEEEL